MREAIQNLSDRGEFFLVLALTFGFFIFSSALVLLRGDSSYDLSTQRAIFAIAIELALMSAAAWVLRVRGKRLMPLGFRFSWGALLAGLPLFAGWYLLYWITWAFVVSVHPPAQQLRTMNMTVSAPGWLVIAFILVNSVFEEAGVAGYVVTQLTDQGVALAVTASALLRFAYHLYQGPIASIGVLPLGFLFAAVYWRWRTLWPLIGAHTIANLISVLAHASAA